MTPMIDDDSWYFATDTVSATISESTDGVTTTDDGDLSFQWNAIPTVDATEVPSAYREFFDTDDFYKFDATVARPIEQQYYINGDEYTFKKPREELKQSAWSLDNAPWTLDHPDAGRVTSVDEIHGFWKNPYYDDDGDNLRSSLFVPTADETALEYIADTEDVSVGFYNRLAQADEDGIDAYQTSMYFDHCASVQRGRCPSEKGCGLETDGVDHGHMVETDGMTANGNVPDHRIDGTTMIDASKFVHPDDGQWYAVPPSDNPDDKWKFPVNNCRDVDDAWHFAIRERGDISISFGTLMDRIQRRAKDLDCNVPGTSNDSEQLSVDSLTTDYYTDLYNETMTDPDCDCGGDGSGDSVTFPVADMDPEAVRRRNDSVDELLSEKDETIAEYEADAEALNSVRETIDVDDDDSVVDAVESLHEEYDRLREWRDEYEASRKDDLVEKITEVADYEADDFEDADLETVEDKWETIQSVTDTSEVDEEPDTSPTTANPSTDNEGPTDGEEVDESSIYNVTP